MKAKLLIAIVLMNINLNAQELDKHFLDFWKGSWKISWTNTEGDLVTANNEIAPIANDKVIQESFSDPSTNYYGTSISVYNPNTKTWHQAWADTDGSYYNFIGEKVNGDPSFRTELVEKDGKKIIRRMVFKEIKENSFTWIWEATKNGGESWTELWKVDYKRISKG